MAASLTPARRMVNRRGALRRKTFDIEATKEATLLAVAKSLDRRRAESR